MATKFWICYACMHRGAAKTFLNPKWAKATKEERGGIPYHICPKERCASEDVFPHRVFRCTECKYEHEQGGFFRTGVSMKWTVVDEEGDEIPRSVDYDADLDPDPIKERWSYRCSLVNNEDCKSTSYKQVS